MEEIIVSRIHTAAYDSLIPAMLPLAQKIHKSLTLSEITKIQDTYRKYLHASCAKFDKCGLTIKQVPKLIQATLIYMVSGQEGAFYAMSGFNLLSEYASNNDGLSLKCMCVEMVQAISKYRMIGNPNSQDQVAVDDGKVTHYIKNM